MLRGQLTANPCFGRYTPQALGSIVNAYAKLVRGVNQV
jgi:hypothetical protein